MVPPDSAASLVLARRHLDKVQTAWTEPTDWADLSLYGFYCLEAAVLAAEAHFGRTPPRTHVAKTSAAAALHSNHDLPDVTDLLRQLNEARKSEAYGDVARPDLDAEDAQLESRRSLKPSKPY